MYAAALLVSATISPVVPTSYDLIVADAVLREPAAVPPPPFWRAGRNAFMTVLVREEAIDPEGMSYMFPPAADWASEVNCARQNLAKVKNCPPLADLEWLPDWVEAHRLYLFNYEHANRLTERRCWEPDRAQILGRAVVETRALQHFWWLVAEARAHKSWGSPRRLRLGAVRAAYVELMGEEAWLRREPPPAVASWTFTPR